MIPICKRYRWGRAIARIHKPAFIILAFLAWISPPAGIAFFSQSWTPLSLIIGPAIFFPVIGLMVVLSVAAIRHYHPLMWMAVIPVATTIYAVVWLEPTI